MTLDDLVAYGANVEEGLGRCMGMEPLYLKLCASIKDEARFADLESALADGRLDDAFEAAHALKGVLGNLSLTPLQKPMEEITELLRSRTNMDYAPLAAHIKAEYERFCVL